MTAAPADSGPPTPAGPKDVRERILEVASDLFYHQGVRAVGVDLVISKAAVAKASLYRHFRTKDDLVVAFLEREDLDFWSTWDAVTAAHEGDPLGELAAHAEWIGARVSRLNYRGCPQINVAAEFADQDHPSRDVARAHMRGLRERLAKTAEKLEVVDPAELATQLTMLINGAFVSQEVLAGTDAASTLQRSFNGLVKAARKAR